MNAQEIRTYSQELAAKKGLPQEKVQKILEALGDDQIAQMIAEGFIDTPTYSRSLDGKVAEAKAAIEKAQKYDQWWAENKPKYDAVNSALQKYKEKYGDLDDGGNPPEHKPQANGEYLTKAQLEEALKDYGSRSVTVAKKLTKFASQFGRRYGEDFDPDAFEKFTVDNNIQDMDLAYEKWTKPKEEALSAKQREQDRQQMREELERELRSKLNVPVDSGPKEAHLLFDQLKSSGTGNAQGGNRGGLDDFVAGWTEHAAKQ